MACSGRGSSSGSRCWRFCAKVVVGYLGGEKAREHVLSLPAGETPAVCGRSRMGDGAAHMAMIAGPDVQRRIAFPVDSCCCWCSCCRHLIARGPTFRGGTLNPDRRPARRNAGSCSPGSPTRSILAAPRKCHYSAEIAKSRRRQPTKFSRCYSPDQNNSNRRRGSSPTRVVCVYPRKLRLRDAAGR